MIDTIRKRIALWAWHHEQDIDHYVEKWVRGWNAKPSERRYWERKLERAQRRTKRYCAKAGHPLDFDDSREGMRECLCSEVQEWRQAEAD